MADNNQGLNGTFRGLSYRGVNALQPPEMYINYRDPGENDSRGYRLGDLWLTKDKTDPTVHNPWMLADLTEDVATWISIAGGSTGFLQTLTGNIGDIVFPDNAKNINILGALGSGFVFEGIDVNHVLSLSTSGGGPIAQTITGDVGGAVQPDAAGNWNLVGDGTITVTGNPGTNTLTLSTSGGQVFNVTTIDDTPTALAAFTLADDQAIDINCLIAAAEVNYTAALVGYVNGGGRRHGGGAVLIGAPVSSFSQDFGAGSPSMTLDANGNDIRIMVTGVAATTIKWRGRATFILQDA
jgi:hypothetical protein